MLATYMRCMYNNNLEVKIEGDKSKPAISWLKIERSRFPFTRNGKREFAPCDQVFPLIVDKCLLLQLKNKYFHASFIHKNCSEQFLSAYFLF